MIFRIKSKVARVFHKDYKHELEKYITANYVDPKKSLNNDDVTGSYMAPEPCPMPAAQARPAETHPAEAHPMAKAMVFSTDLTKRGQIYSRKSSVESDEVSVPDYSILDTRVGHLQDTFSQYLMHLISVKGMKNSDVYKRALVDKKVFSKIKNNTNYHPDKITAMCLCVGAKLNMDETKDLLSRAGYALSPCDKRDVIFSFFIENEIYDMIEIDIQLGEYGLKCLIS